VPIGKKGAKLREFLIGIGRVAEFPTASWDAAPTSRTEHRLDPSRYGAKFLLSEKIMFGRIMGAVVGEKLAGRNSKGTGALIGAAIPFIARRGLGPLGLALGAGWAAKKLYDRNRDRRAAPIV
jgi:hypothetical protein